MKLFTWQGDTFDMSAFDRMEPDRPSTTVRLISDDDGWTCTLTSYPGEGLWLKIRALYPHLRVGR